MDITLPSGRKLGDGHPVFIIAEVGSNWRTLDDCLDSIHQAKQAGADAVKFQLFTHRELFGADSIMAHCLPKSWLSRLKARADECGIEFMCSAFSPEGYELVNPHVNIHKVASAECTHVRILEAVNRMGKPVVLSTGAHGAADIGMAMEVLGDVNIVLMYCVAAYPAQEIELGNIALLRNTFNCLSGYSDHSNDVCIIPKAAMVGGACVIEKHVTVIPEHETPDRAHAITTEQLQRMVKSIRGSSIPILQASREENGMVVRHNRRLIATKEIKQGDTLVENGNFGIYRSLKDDAHAYSPFLIDQVNGKIAARPIQAGDGIGPGDLTDG